jgi:hypothetical protein
VSYASLTTFRNHCSEQADLCLSTYHQAQAELEAATNPSVRIRLAEARDVAVSERALWVSLAAEVDRYLPVLYPGQPTEADVPIDGLTA